MESNLSTLQKVVMTEFYGVKDVKVPFNKKERKSLWDAFISDRSVRSNIDGRVPTLNMEIEKAVLNGKNIQSAIFSECVYAQSLANKFGLTELTAYNENDYSFKGIEFFRREEISDLTIRYSYEDRHKSQTLIQAGGNTGVDAALILSTKKEAIMIEFKEPYAKTSEPDLPKYREDGLLLTNSEFDRQYPQFKNMLNEKIREELNLLKHMGQNVNNFSPSSISIAVTENYAGEKFADVICTEDKDGYLVMLPSNQVGLWAELEGEIRPSGRNAYQVWTPKDLEKTLQSLGAKLEHDLVVVNKNKLVAANARGSKNVSRAKISPHYFVRIADVEFREDIALFALKSIRQLNPSIAAKMNFKNLSVNAVREFYESQLSL